MVPVVEEHRRLFGNRPPNNMGKKICVSGNKNATTAPSTFEKVSMALARLEEKSICFSGGGNSQHMQEKILEAFPILETARGYEILRTVERGNRQPMVLSMPPGG